MPGKKEDGERRKTPHKKTRRWPAERNGKKLQIRTDISALSHLLRPNPLARHVGALIQQNAIIVSQQRYRYSVIVNHLIRQIGGSSHLTDAVKMDILEALLGRKDADRKVQTRISDVAGGKDTLAPVDVRGRHQTSSNFLGLAIFTIAREWRPVDGLMQANSVTDNSLAYEISMLSTHAMNHFEAHFGQFNTRFRSFMSSHGQQISNDDLLPRPPAAPASGGGVPIWRLRPWTARCILTSLKMLGAMVWSSMPHCFPLRLTPCTGSGC